MLAAMPHTADTSEQYTPVYVCYISGVKMKSSTDDKEEPLFHAKSDDTNAVIAVGNSATFGSI